MPYGGGKRHMGRGKKRDFVEFKNKYYENDSCSLLIQTGAIDVAVLFLGLS